MNLEIIINDVEKAAAETVQVNEGDFVGEYGLLYCGKCGTPKQGEYKMPWGVVRPYCLCKCATEARDKAIAEQKQIEFISSMQSTWDKWGFSFRDLQGCSFENDDMQNPRISQAMKNYVEHFPELRRQGQGLLLYGNVGTGKTFLSVAAANALINKGYPVLVTNFGSMCNIIGGTYEGKQELYDSLNRFALLVIDDLGAERKTEYMQEIVYNVIDSRYRAGLPMIITTNLTADELKNPQDITNKRIYDRVLERCLPVEVKGKNRRHVKVKDNFNELNSLLGL